MSSRPIAAILPQEDIHLRDPPRLPQMRLWQRILLLIDTYQLIAMNSLVVPAMFTATPDWFWFLVAVVLPSSCPHLSLSDLLHHLPLNTPIHKASRAPSRPVLDYLFLLNIPRQLYAGTTARLSTEMHQNRTEVNLWMKRACSFL